MTDAIDAAIDSVQAPVESNPAPEATTNETPALSAEASMDAKLEAVYDRLNPPRAPDGKFANRIGNNPVSVEPPEGEQELTDQPSQETVGQPQEPPAAVTEPPQAWSAAQKELWASIPPAAQEFVARREAEAHKAITRMGQELSKTRPLNELLSTHRDTFSRHGVDPQAGIARLLDVQARLDHDAYDGIAAIADIYGVDLAAFAGQQQQYQDPQGNPVQPDPYVQSLEQRLNQLTQRLTEREKSENREREQQTHQLQRQTDEEVGKWANGKDHFDEPAVKQMMAAAIGNGTAETLDEAYDMACNAIPSIRQKIREVERKTEEAKRAEDQRKKAAEAKRANTVNVGSSARRVASVPSGKWDSEAYLENLYDRTSAG
jgi:hypothetical protein